MEIDGPDGDPPEESSFSQVVVPEDGSFGNPISSSDLTNDVDEQQQPPSRKRKFHAEEDSGIDPYQPALKVLRVEEQQGGDQRNDPQSASIRALGQDSSIEDKESFMNPHQSALEALLVVEDRSGNYADSLAALRDYSGAGESPSPVDVMYNNVSFSNPLEPFLEGLQQSQEIRSADIGNVLSCSPPPPPIPDLKALHVPMENRARDEAEFRVIDPLSELEPLHVLEKRVEDETQLRVSDPLSELEALPVDANYVEDETEMRLDDPQSDLEALDVIESDPQPHLEAPPIEESDPQPKLEPSNVEELISQPHLEALHVIESDPQPQLEAIHVEAFDPHPKLEPLLVEEINSQSQLEALHVEQFDPQPKLEPLNVEEINSQPQLEALHVIENDPQPQLEALHVEESSNPQSQLEALHVIENDPQPQLEALYVEESDPQPQLKALHVEESDPQPQLEALHVIENDPQPQLEALEEKVSVSDPLTELEALPVAENCGENETKVRVSDPWSESVAMEVVECATGEGVAANVQYVSDPSSELDVKPMEFVENSGADETQTAAKKRKLVLLAAVAAFFSTLAGALGSIGQLIGQLEKTTMAGVSEDLDGHLGIAGMTSTSTFPSPPRESTALRLHAAITRSSSSLRNNILVSMFLLMQQHRKRSQKRPRELTGPWYIKPRSAQAFDSLLDFGPQGDPEKFRELFRISPSLFFHICEMVRDEMLSDTPRSLRVLPNRVLTVGRQVAIAIRRLATGNQFLGIADSFGVSKSTAVKVTWKFIVAFIKKARPLHLEWPNGEQMQQIKDGFKSQWGFPNCCGVVDGTHFTVEFPKGEDVSQYYDHQNHVSISMQAIVGHDQRFLDVVVGWPGSIQEYQLLQNTNFFGNVVNTKERLSGDSYITQDGSSLREYILGDAGYPLYDWLMVPYPSGLSAAKDEWNSRHAVAKQCVEDALVRLKGTWKILSRILWKPRKERIGKMVFACCLLHNMIIEQNDGLNPEVYAGGNPHPGGYTGVSIPTEEVFEGGPEAREVLFREVMGGGIV